MLTSRHLAVAALAAACLAGCGDSENSRAAVQGSVKYDGQPVDQGGIAFLPLGEEAGATRVRATGDIRDGHYELDRHRGPLPGKYRVQIYWRKKIGQKPSGEEGDAKQKTEQVMPPKYNTQSGLIRDVEPGRNTIDFDLPK